MVCLGCFILEIVVYVVLVLTKNVKIYIHSRIYNEKHNFSDSKVRDIVETCQPFLFYHVILKDLANSFNLSSKYLKYNMCLGDLMRYFANLRHAKLNLWLMLWARFPDDILNLEFCCSFLLKKVFLCINLILPFFLYIIFILFILYLT